MKPVIKYFYSSDVDVDTYVSEDPLKDGVFLRMIIGDDQGKGEESFDVMVCTPSWLADEQVLDKPIFGRGYLFMARLDLQEAMLFLREQISSVEGDSWEAVANQIARYSIWEFDSYRPYESGKSNEASD